MGWNVMFNWCNLRCILSRKGTYLLHSRLPLSNVTHHMCDIVGAVCSLMWVREEGPKLWLCREDTAFVSQGSEQPLPSSTAAEKNIYLFMEGPQPLPCGAQPFPPVFPFVWGAESPFWHSHVEEKHFCSKAQTWASRGLQRSLWTGSTFCTGHPAGFTAGPEPSHGLFSYKSEK